MKKETQIMANLLTFCTMRSETTSLAWTSIVHIVMIFCLSLQLSSPSNKLMSALSWEICRQSQHWISIIFYFFLLYSIFHVQPSPLNLHLHSQTVYELGPWRMMSQRRTMIGAETWLDVLHMSPCLYNSGSNQCSAQGWRVREIIQTAAKDMLT